MMSWFVKPGTLLVFTWLTAVAAHQVLPQPASYTPSEDVSFAIHSPHLSTPDKQYLYDSYIQGCYQAAQEMGSPKVCDKDEAWRMKMNREQPSGVYNYTHRGYEKIRVPTELFRLIKDFYDQNKHRDKIEWDRQLNSYHNMWEAPPTFVQILDPDYPGGGSELEARVMNLVQPILEAWTGQRLAPVSLYGIRIYHSGSILAPHVDRMPLVTSAIINVDQDVDEPWPLEVYGHDGLAVNVTMEAGDMVMYESHSIIHGRPFPFQGSHYANIFVHFEPLGSLDEEEETRYRDLPPYVIPDSTWEEEWKRENPNGWNGIAMAAREAATVNDVSMLQRIAESDPNQLHQPDDLGWLPLHEAVRVGHVDAVKLLLQNGDDINHETKTGVTPLNIARRSLGDDHRMTQFLIDNGGIDISPEL